MLLFHVSAGADYSDINYVPPKLVAQMSKFDEIHVASSSLSIPPPTFSFAQGRESYSIPHHQCSMHSSINKTLQVTLFNP
jgi:hypothetical protein